MSIFSVIVRSVPKSELNAISNVIRWVNATAAYIGLTYVAL